MAIIRERDNARFSDPVNLRSRFYKDGQLYDPEVIDRIEIWKHGESERTGGVLVDVIPGDQVIQDDVGQYRLIYDPYLECGSPECAHSPATGIVNGPFSPIQSPLESPVDELAEITPDAMYFDRWCYRPTPGYPELKTTGLQFYLFPDGYFVDSPLAKYRFEIKPDRKMLVKGENLDMRLRIIPIPLYRARRKPIIDYLVPISTMEYQWIDTRTKEVLVDWTVAGYTGQEAVIPTQALATFQLGTYLLKARLQLPNGQWITYPQIEIALRD